MKAHHKGGTVLHAAPPRLRRRHAVQQAQRHRRPVQAFPTAVPRAMRAMMNAVSPYIRTAIHGPKRHSTRRDHRATTPRRDASCACRALRQDPSPDNSTHRPSSSPRRRQKSRRSTSKPPRARVLGRFSPLLRVSMVQTDRAWNVYGATC